MGCRASAEHLPGTPLRLCAERLLLLLLPTSRTPTHLPRFRLSIYFYPTFLELSSSKLRRRWQRCRLHLQQQLLELPGKTHTARNRGDAVRVGSCLQPARSLGKGLGCSPSLSQRCRQCLHLLQALVVGLLIFFMGLHHDHTSGTLGACGCTQVLHRREESCWEQESQP